MSGTIGLCMSACLFVSSAFKQDRHERIGWCVSVCAVNLSVTLHLPACQMPANKDLAPRRLILYLPITHKPTHAHIHAQHTN